MVGFMPILSGTLSADFGSMQKIASITPNGTSEVVSFTNIPQTYQDLVLICHAINDIGAANPLLYIDNINGAGTADRSNTRLTGLGGGTSSSTRNSAQNFISISDNALAANTPAVAEVHILNYTSSTVSKTFLTQVANDKNGSGIVALAVGKMTSTSAITQINITSYVVGAKWTSGSIFSLYGIRASA